MTKESKFKNKTKSTRNKRKRAQRLQMIFCRCCELMAWCKRANENVIDLAMLTGRKSRQTNFTDKDHKCHRDNVPVNSGWITEWIERGLQSMKRGRESRNHYLGSGRSSGCFPVGSCRWSTSPSGSCSRRRSRSTLLLCWSKARNQLNVPTTSSES